MVTLSLLVVIGLAIGIGLKLLISDELKTEIIVKPNFDSKDYLYNVVKEIEANLRVRDTVFFEELGIVTPELKSLRIEIEPIEENEEVETEEEDLKYLEILQNFKDDSFISDVVKTEILKKSGMNHRITIFYKNALPGREAAKRLMEYINSNEYLNNLKDIYNENARIKIERNQELITQIDSLIYGYTRNLAQENRVEQGTVVLENEKSLEIPSLLSLKNALLKEIERKKLEVAEQKNVIKVVNFGKTQKVKKPVYTQGILIIPVVFVIFFFLVSIVKYLNVKANEIERDTA